MKNLTLILICTFLLIANLVYPTTNVFSVNGTNTYLNDKEILVIGLRCSNALMSDETTTNLIEHLDLYKSFGVNTISVFFQGSRFGDIKGYNEDGSLNPEYSKRMALVIEACDKREMVVLVGCLYWGGSMAKWESWTQKEANMAVANTVKWLSENDYRNVFVDPDNEGMANRAKGFNIEEMIVAGKKVDSDIVIGFNNHGYPSSNADLALHFSDKTNLKPYIESEGTMTDYWGSYSKEKGLYNYINIGIYTEGKKKEQLLNTDKHLQKGKGYIFASTWLQCIPPNSDPGGDGSPCNPGISWWLEYIKRNYK
jgi:hypothetical protein